MFEFVVFVGIGVLVVAFVLSVILAGLIVHGGWLIKKVFMKKGGIGR